MHKELTANREANENEDRFSMIFVAGEFDRYFLKAEKLKDVDAQMKAKGYSKAGFRVGGAYMKVNYLPTAVVKKLRSQGMYV